MSEILRIIRDDLAMENFVPVHVGAIGLPYGKAGRNEAEDRVVALHNYLNRRHNNGTQNVAVLPIVFGEEVTEEDRYNATFLVHAEAYLESGELTKSEIDRRVAYTLREESQLVHFVVLAAQGAQVVLDGEVWRQVRDSMSHEA